MDYETLYAQADEEMAQEVILTIQADIDQYGAFVWGDVYQTSFDAVILENKHLEMFDDQFNSQINNLRLFHNDQEIDIEGVDYYDLIEELNSKFPRLMNLEGKLLKRK